MFNIFMGYVRVTIIMVSMGYVSMCDVVVLICMWHIIVVIAMRRIRVRYVAMSISMHLIFDGVHVPILMKILMSYIVMIVVAGLVIVPVSMGYILMGCIVMVTSSVVLMGCVSMCYVSVSILLVGTTVNPVLELIFNPMTTFYCCLCSEVDRINIAFISIRVDVMKASNFDPEASQNGCRLCLDEGP
jgi:hypothetical protein